MVNKRNYNLDVIKFIAACSVVFLHTEFSGVFGIAIDTLAAFAVPIFFMISGYLFGQSVDKERFIKKQIIKLSKIYLLGLIIYAFFDYLLYKKMYFTFDGLIGFFTVPMGHASHLWFLAALIEILLLLKITKLYKHKRIFIFITLVLFITGFYFIFFPANFISWKLYISLIFFGLPLFGLGFITSIYLNKIPVISKDTLLLSTVLMFIISIFVRILLIYTRTISFNYETTPFLLLPTWMLLIYLIQNPLNKIPNKIILNNLNIYLWHIIPLTLAQLIFNFTVGYNSEFSTKHPLYNLLLIAICIVSALLFGKIIELSKKIFVSNNPNSKLK